METVAAFDLAGFIDQIAQGFASAVQSVLQQSRKSGVQRMMLDTLCHREDSFVGVGQNPRRNRLRTMPAGVAPRCGAVLRSSRATRPPRCDQPRITTPAGYEFTERVLHQRASLRSGTVSFAREVSST